MLTLGNALERTRTNRRSIGRSGQVWLESAQVRGDRIDLRKAREALEPIASTPAATSGVLLLAGRAALEDDDLESAERSLQQACDRFPIEPTALLLYANVAERQNHPDAARRALIQYEALVASDSDDVTHAIRIAALSVRVNDRDTADTWVMRGLARDPQNVQLLALARRINPEPSDPSTRADRRPEN